MHLQQRINAFAALGDFLSQFTAEDPEKKYTIMYNDLFFDGLLHQIRVVHE